MQDGIDVDKDDDYIPNIDEAEPFNCEKFENLYLVWKMLLSQYL